jgi:hypothetical protein
MINTANTPSKPTTTPTTNSTRRATTARLFLFNTNLPDTLVHYAPECVEGEFSELRAGLRELASCLRSKGLEPVYTERDRKGASSSMQYLVTEELINPGPQLPPDQLVGIMRQWVLPSMDTLINLKSEGKIIAGGLPVGERALVLIFEAESNEELDTALH